MSIQKLIHIFPFVYNVFTVRHIFYTYSTSQINSSGILATFHVLNNPMRSVSAILDSAILGPTVLETCELLFQKAFPGFLLASI